MLGIALYAYSTSGSPWWLFAVLLLAPDISMVGYIRGPVLGSITYNIGHSLVGPVALVAWNWAGGPDLAFAVGAIWLAHVGMDRALGYGLKHEDDFRHTHLGWIGPAGRPS